MCRAGKAVTAAGATQFLTINNYRVWSFVFCNLENLTLDK